MSDAPFEVVAPPRRARRAALVASGVLGPLAVAVVWLYVRGTVAESVPLDATAKPVCHLLLRDGATIVRGARVVPASADAVWATVTDYESFKETFPFLRSVRVTREPGDRVRFEATVDARVETLDYAVTIEHAREGERRIARWEGAGGRFATNRGSWTVTPLDGQRTLVEYALELEVRPWPTFIVRDVLLSRIPVVLAGLDQHVKK